MTAKRELGGELALLAVLHSAGAPCVWSGLITVHFVATVAFTVVLTAAWSRTAGVSSS